MPSQSTPQNGSNNGQKSARYVSVMSRLRRMAEPIRSNSYKHLAMSKLKPNTSEPSISNSATNNKNPGELTNWMASITKRAKAALVNDDKLEDETRKQVSKIRNKYLDSDDEDELIHESTAFASLGELLSKRKRPQNTASYTDKRQKVSLTQLKCIFFIIKLISNPHF